MRVTDRERLRLDARVDAGAVLTQEFLLCFVAGADFSLPYVSALSALSVAHIVWGWKHLGFPKDSDCSLAADIRTGVK